MTSRGGHRPDDGIHGTDLNHDDGDASNVPRFNHDVNSIVVRYASPATGKKRYVEKPVGDPQLRFNLWRYSGTRLGWLCRNDRTTQGALQMATFIALKRPGPPAKEVLVNLDQILMVQPGQGSGSAILFGREHLVNFEEDVPTVIRRIQTGPYIRTDQSKPAG